MKKFALFLLLFLVGAPLIRVVTKAMLGTFGGDAAVAAGLFVALALFVAGVLAWRKLVLRSPIRRVQAVSAAPSPDELVWPALPRPTGPVESSRFTTSDVSLDAPALESPAAHTPIRHARPGRWLMPGWAIAACVCVAGILAAGAIEQSFLVKVADKQVAPTPFASLAKDQAPSTVVRQPAHATVESEIEQKVAMMGWALHELDADEWKPCNSTDPVTDTSCKMISILLHGEVVGVVFDDPRAPPRYKHFVLWKN